MFQHIEQQAISFNIKKISQIGEKTNKPIGMFTQDMNQQFTEKKFGKLT